MAPRNKWRSAVKSSCRRPKANRTKRLLQACRSTLKPWHCGEPVFAAKAPIVCGRWQREGDGSRTIRTKRSKLLSTPPYKLAPQGATHWSCRTLAEQQGVSKGTISRVWQSHQLKPHLQKTFKLSRDAKFLEKLTDVVGLYLNPPEKALVLCVDEKSQIQALDRTQPGLPLKKGRCGTMTHDYKRNGTTTLFAALEWPKAKWSVSASPGIAIGSF
jgi:hypothetical protein